MSPSPSGRQPSHPGLRALVIDDEGAIRRVLRRYLERAGWQVDEALDGASAGAKLFQVGSTYDLVICDLNLPDCTGLDLRRELDARAPELLDRFVVSTGESAEGSGALSGAEARELMMSGHLLAKPFSLDDLGALLRKVPTAVAAA